MSKIIVIMGIVIIVLIAALIGQNAGVFEPLTNVSQTPNSNSNDATNTNNNGGTNNTGGTDNKVISGNRTLDLSNQGLKSIPSYVFSQTNVEELNVSGNQLTGAIQAEIRHLGNLKILNASNNKMTGVPAEVGQLQKLEVLDLSHNQLTGLPYELGNLKNLKVLDVSGNQYSQQDLDYIRTKLPSTVKIILN